jgi:PleD family two-component response regulator
VASAGELLRRADFAMYTAKDRGRARIEHYDALNPADRPPQV